MKTGRSARASRSASAWAASAAGRTGVGRVPFDAVAVGSADAPGSRTVGDAVAVGSRTGTPSRSIGTLSTTVRRSLTATVQARSASADAVAADDAIAAGLASNNTGDHLKIVDVPDTTWSYGIAVKSGQDELVGQIDAALRAMVKDGSWQKAAADMGKSIGYTPDASMNPPKATAKAPSSGASAASEK